MRSHPLRFSSRITASLLRLCYPFCDNASLTKRGCTMRLTFLTLFLCTGVAAFSQSPAPTTVTPDTLGQMLSAPTQPTRDFSKPPTGLYATNAAPLGTFILPGTETARRWDEAKIDPKMIVHPPLSSIGVQPPGRLVAQNEYPNLRMLPIESSSSKALPAQWPLLQVKKIPLQWLKRQLGPSNRSTSTIEKIVEK